MRRRDEELTPHLPQPRGTNAGLGLIAAAVALTAAVGFFVKRAQDDPRRNAELPIPRLSNDRFTVKLIGTGVDNPPVAPVIPAAAWAEFEVQIDGKPSVSGQTAFRTSARDEAGNPILCRGIWVDRRYFVILQPGLAKWKGAIRISVSRSASELCLATVATPRTPKDWFDPTPRPPRNGVSVEFLRIEGNPAQLGLRVLIPKRPHELYLVSWGGSSTSPVQFDERYLVVPPYDHKGPSQRVEGNLIPVFQNYSENAHAVRLELIRLRARPHDRRLEFPVPYHSLTGEGPGFGANIIREPNHPFILLSPVGRYAKPSSPATLLIQRTVEGHPSRMLSESSEMTLISPARVAGHPLKLINSESRLRVGSGVIEGRAQGEIKGQQPDEIVKIRIAQKSWEFEEVDRQQIVLPFELRSTKEIKKWNLAPLLVRFDPPNHLEFASNMGQLTFLSRPHP